ncbi:S24 family peptidase [Sphingobium sp. H39-3-25]|uniref:S24 family peptidase n=1 Tax=Sphingobium arseniciresistens TaxID=3030834 RepID=UPI0023B8EEA3|nr:S24 family peptidase [Sphingobium arseniciresistens]
MSTPAERLRFARERAGFQSAKDAAVSLGVPTSTYIGHENGSRGIPRDRAPQYARKFKVTEEWLLYGKGGTEAESNVPEGAERVVKVPLLGDVPAGPVREAIRHSRGFVLIPESEAPKDSYALRVSGESMNVHAPNGCTIVVNPNDTDLFPGRRYVVRTGGGEATFKEYHEGPARLVAVSTYDEYEDIRLGSEPTEVLGRVISVTTRL